MRAYLRGATTNGKCGGLTLMWRAVWCVIMVVMATRRLTIEFEEGGLPRGRVVGADGCDAEFTGWVDLAAAIERARERATPRNGSPAPRDEGSCLPDMSARG